MPGDKPYKIPRPNDLPPATTFAPEDWSVAWKPKEGKEKGVYGWKQHFPRSRGNPKLSDIITNGKKRKKR